MNRKYLKYAVIALFIGAIVFGAVKGFQANKAAREANDKAVVTFADMKSDLKTAYNLNTDSQIKNILLVGADKRGSETGYGRSDCMMIASIDSKNNALKLTSLMGDTYVDVPGYGENRLSMAYSMGGISLLNETIALNFGIALDHYAVLEFPEFVKVIDQVGGVQIELTEKEAKYMQEHYTNTVKDVKLGNNTLNGTQALAYVRIKQDALGDYGRNSRQRTIMKALYAQLTKCSVEDLVPVVSGMIANTATDISKDDMKSYLALVLAMANNDIMEKTLPLDSEYTTKNEDGSVAYIIDRQTISQAAYEFIYNPETKEEAQEE